MLWPQPPTARPIRGSPLAYQRNQPYRPLTSIIQHLCRSFRQQKWRPPAPYRSEEAQSGCSAPPRRRGALCAIGPLLAAHKCQNRLAELNLITFLQGAFADTLAVDARTIGAVFIAQEIAAHFITINRGVQS